MANFPAVVQPQFSQSTFCGQTHIHFPNSQGSLPPCVGGYKVTENKSNQLRGKKGVRGFSAEHVS